MLYRQILVVMGLTLALMQLPPLFAQSRPAFEITDFLPESDLQYPNGPTVTVWNHSHVGPLEAWVVRHLDGAIVRRYSVNWINNRWHSSLEITQPGKDFLPSLVLGDNAPAPFTLAFLDGDHVVRLSRGFNVRVTQPGWQTRWTPRPGEEQLAWSGKLASGRFTGIKGHNRLMLAYGRKPSEVSFTLEKDTNITKAARPLRMDDLREGNMLAVIYTEQKGNKIAKEVAVDTARWDPLTLFAHLKKPSPASPPYLMPGVQFQVATVKRMTSQLQALIIDTNTPHGLRQWHITNDTEIVRGKISVDRSEIKAGSLVAAGAKEFKGSPIPALRVLLLRDLSTP